MVVERRVHLVSAGAGIDASRTREIGVRTRTLGPRVGDEGAAGRQVCVATDCLCTCVPASLMGSATTEPVLVSDHDGHLAAAAMRLAVVLRCCLRGSSPTPCSVRRGRQRTRHAVVPEGSQRHGR